MIKDISCKKIHCLIQIQWVQKEQELGINMSIIYCALCDKIKDIDYEEVFDYEDYEMICSACKEWLDENRTDI